MKAEGATASEGLHSLSTTLSLALVAAVASLCLAWTLWLMMLTVSPNATVNWVMDTKTFDDGTFWRFIDPPLEMLLLGLGGLGLVALGYLYIIARVAIFRNKRLADWSPQRISFKSQPRSSRHRVTKIAVTKKIAFAGPIAQPSRKFSSEMASGVIRLVRASKAKRKFVVRDTFPLRQCQRIFADTNAPHNRTYHSKRSTSLCSSSC